MTPERWQQIDKLLEQALEQEPDRRAAFLEEACNGDDALRQEVESLLAAHEQDDGRLSSPALKAANENPTQSPENLIGQALSHYQILTRLGEGGMGVVYKARNTHLKRFVAIKVLPASLVADPDRKRRFVQEARAASALNHPNIITIHDIASDSGRDFMVMEYVEGKTLGQVIPRRGLKMSDVLKYAIQIADALAKAHAVGIVHRDLKPGNIMVGEGGLVRVLDFGLAKLIERPEIEESDTTDTLPLKTEEGVILGTASYMSPEQAVGKPVDARSDIFSFGSVLYEMVTGQRAFQGDSRMLTLAAVLNQDPKPASQISRRVPPELERIINRCLKKDPSRRFQYLADVKVALDELKEESDSGSLQGPEKGPLTKSKRASILQWAGVSGLLVLLAVAAWWFGRSEKVPPEAALNAVPLTAYPGYEFSPSFSPDGNQVAFAMGDKGPDPEGIYTKQNVDIYVKQIGVEDPFRLTDNPAPDLNPAWSPDGQTIAFARQFSPTQIAYIAKPQRGGPERIVAEFTAPADTRGTIPSFYSVSPKCTWTADSKALVVVGMDTKQPGALVLLETLEKRTLIDPSTGMADTDPAISADGRSLVFSRIDPGHRSDLWLVSLSKDLRPLGQPERLTTDTPINRDPAWIPGGSEIVWTSGTSWFFSRSLFRLHPSRDAKPTRLPIAGDLVGRPAISIAGNRLAYEVWRHDTNIWRVEVPGMRAKPKEAMKFISTTRGDTEPRFSPDGTKIAFASSRSGPSGIWVCNSDGSQPFLLASLGDTRTNRPRWSPDGRRIVFWSDARGSRDIYVIDAGGGGLRRLTNHPCIDTNADWSADGKWIYFQSDRTGSNRIWKVSLTGGDAIPVGEIGESSPVQSRDGKFLYYDKGWPDTFAIWRVPTGGGAESQFIDRVHATGGWVVMDDGIYYISKPDEKGVSHIRFKDFGTGSDRVVVPIEGRVDWGLTVSPDRRTFLYTLAEEAGSDLMLVENFR